MFDYSNIFTNTIINKLNNLTNIETIYVLEGNQRLTKLSYPQKICSCQAVLYTIIMDKTMAANFLMLFYKIQFHVECILYHYHLL